MTLESTVNKNKYIGNGTTKNFPFTFKVWNKKEVVVVVGDGVVENEVSSNCKITITSTGGSVEFPTAPASGSVVVIHRSMPYIQEDDYINGSRFNSEEIEDRFDQDCAERQDLRLDIGRAIKVPLTSSLSPEDLFRLFMNAVQALQDVGDVSGLSMVKASNSLVYRTLADRFADIINVKDFGAKGDGTTDDTDAIQAALNLCSGKAVWFPAGSYLISRTLRVVYGNCAIFGTDAKIMLQDYLPLSTDRPASGTVPVAEAVHRIVGLRVVGVSNVSISGLSFEKVWHGIDVFLSESPSDYPATESNNIHDIVIDNCTFNTSQWAVSIVGVYGLKITNITLNQGRTATYSNKDGIHLHGCVNVVIDNVIGTTDDDFIAIFPKESYIGSTATFYGVCNKIFINNCVVNNNANITSDEGARSFLGIEGCQLPSGDVHKFSLDNVFISNCSIVTDTGVALRLTGGLADKYIGTVKFSNCFISRSYTPGITIQAQNSMTFIVKSGIDEFVLENCKYSLDTRFNDNNLTVGPIGIFKNARRIAIIGCHFSSNNKFISVDNLGVSGLSDIEIIDIESCVFDATASTNNEIVIQTLNRDIDSIVFKNNQTGPTVANAIKVLNCTVGELHVERGMQTANPYLQLDGTGAITKIFPHAMNIANNLVGIPGENTKSVSVVGDFTSKMNNVFSEKAPNIKASGVHLADVSWATKSDPGSICWFGPSGGWKMGIMTANEAWALIEGTVPA